MLFRDDSNMKSHARVVVIGGGIGGCSTLYHLTREGWTDVVLVERDELTSGSTWHASAQVTNFGPVQTMVGLKSHSIRLYQELSQDPEFPFSYHITGGTRLAHSADHLDGYRHFVSMAKGMGVDFEVLDAEETVRRHPLMTQQGLLGCLWDPLDGYIDPNGVTQAMARRARQAGAEIYRFNPVEAITLKSNGEWIVHTKNGDITCEHVVNASGYRANEIGRMLGVVHPIVSMEHMYFLTEPIPQLQAQDWQVPIIRCPKDDFYSRQEKQGLLVGIYEQACKTWGMDGIDPGFTMQLCPNDLDRCLDNMDRVFERLPCLTETGIHTVINGPITYTPDGLPLIGPIPGLRNAYACLGLRAGIGEGGGHGKMLAQIIIYGQAEFDTWCLDPRRLTSHCTTEYTALKAIEDYRNEFRFHLPHEYRPAGRPAKTTPLYPLLKARDAAFGTVNGWERALFFKPTADFVDEPSFRFTPTQTVVAEEVRAVQERVGLMEVSGFTRLEVSGPGAETWLNGLYVGRMPKVGKVSLTYAVTDSGQVLSEATIARLENDRFWLGAAAAAEWHDRDWLHQRLPASGVNLANLTAQRTILVVAGPRSRELLQSVSPRGDWSKAAFPWLSVREMLIGPSRVVAMSVSFSGELAYELHVPNESLYAVYKTIEDAGAAYGLKPFGLYATESMRLEKGYRHWKADLINEFNPFEAGLGRFVRFDKENYVGKTVLVSLARQPFRRQFVVMTINADHAAPHSGDSVWAGGKVVGTVTSAGWGHRVGKNIAMAYVESEYAAEGSQVEVDIIGDRFTATVVPECLYDPQNQRVRAISGLEPI